jgi:uncharacterized protein YkwD
VVAVVLSGLAIFAQLVGSSGVVDRDAETHLRNEVIAEHDRLCSTDLVPAGPRTVALARYRSRDMAQHAYFSHVDRRGGHLVDRLRAWRISYRFAGEDLAWNRYPADLSAEGAYQSLLASVSHRTLIRDCQYTRVAVGAFRLDNRTVFTVLFRRPL